jgi:hypothetical protein
MEILRKLFRTTSGTKREPNVVLQHKTLGEYITEAAAGANLVDGKQPWEHANESKDDIEVMLRCCEAELETMNRTKLVAAPFYFERVAILYRRAKRFDKEIEICQRYADAVESYYTTVAQGFEADVRKGPRYIAIRSRIAKARELFAKAQSDA